ncbi:MerR family DNA-binding transcriptional regulator [Rhodospirillaceae bacterium]|nr:MerR family DNA-binding transcriptional regulator [Rhodospirillaceae bacterium]
MEIGINEALNQAIAAQKAGHLQKAELYYSAILQKKPDHPDVNHNMGVLAYTIGKIDRAITFFQNAIKNNPEIPQYWVSYINLLIEQNRIDEADRSFEDAFKKGITKDPFGEIKRKLGKTGLYEKHVIDAPYSPKYLTTGTVAERVGVHRDTLLRWLRMGLIPEPKRDRKGWRKFTLEETNAILLFSEGKDATLFNQ